MFRAMEIPEPGPLVPRRGGSLRAAIGRIMLRLLRWRIGSAFPDLPKAVVIAAPHSSYRDFFVGIALVFAMRLDARFIGKVELFRGPLGPVMRWLGGLPVNRTRPGGIVVQTVAMFAERKTSRPLRWTTAPSSRSSATAILAKVAAFETTKARRK